MTEVTPSPDRKIIKLLTFDNLFLAKTRSRLTMATTFSRQNDAGSRARTSWYWENLVLEVVLILESKAVYSLPLLSKYRFTLRWTVAETYAICDDPLARPARRGAPLLRYRNGAVYVSKEALSSTEFVSPKELFSLM